VDECPPGPAVAVGERVDRLELRVHHRRLHQRGRRVAADEGGQVRQQREHLLGWGRDEGCPAGVCVDAPDPVLRLAHPSRDVRCVVAQQPLVQGDEVVDGDLRPAAGVLHGQPHRRDVAEHGVGGGVPVGDPRDRLRLVPGQPAA